MAPPDDIIARWRQDRAIMQGILEEMESGELKMKGQSGLESSLVDTIGADIERYKRQIAELDAVISRHPEAG